MTKEERAAYRAGFEKAKMECIEVLQEWSFACHPKHPRTDGNPAKTRCWQYHGLQAAKRSIKRDVRLADVEIV